MRSTFWNRIEIEDDCPNFWGDDDYIEDQEDIYYFYLHETIGFFLDCTDGGPFSFTFCMESAYREQNTYDGFMLLLQYSDQWEEASIRLWPSGVRFLEGHFPLLKKLEIHIYTNEYSKMVVFDDAPLLTHVVLWDIPTWQFDWSSLTIVSFQDTEDYKHILATLQKTINLVELTVNDAFGEDDDINGGTSIRLPHLQSLSVCGAKLLIVLETPALRRLKINFCEDDPESSLSEVGTTVSFLRRPEIKLDILVVESVPAAGIKEILPFTPDINNLSLVRIPNVANVFNWLAGTGEQESKSSCLNVVWGSSKHVGEGLVALHDTIARRSPLGDTMRSRSPKEVIIQRPGEGQNVAANLRLLCRERGIRFMFAEEMSTLTWGIEL